MSDGLIDVVSFVFVCALVLVILLLLTPLYSAVLLN